MNSFTLAILFVLGLVWFYFAKIKPKQKLKKKFAELAQEDITVSVHDWGPLTHENAFVGMRFEFTAGDVAYFGKVIKIKNKKILIDVWNSLSPVYRVWTKEIEDGRFPELFLDSKGKYRVPTLPNNILGSV